MHGTQAAVAVGLGLGLLGLVGCSDDDRGSGISVTSSERSGGGGGPRFAARYQEFGTCDELLEWAKEQMLARVTPYGLGGWYWFGDDMAVPAAAESRDASVAAESTIAISTETSGAGTSGTNTQEAGVDEGDLAETDGRFVYSIVGGVLRSIDIDAGTVVSELSVLNGASQMILDGDRLLVAGQDWSNGDLDTVASVYAIDAGALTLLGRTHLEGNLISVRALDGTVRIVLDQPFATRLPFVQPRTGSSDEEDEALEQNEDVIRAATIDQLLPRQYVEDPNGGSTSPAVAIDCAEIGHPQQFSGLSTTWVATVDLRAATPSATGAAGVIASAQTVYSSADHLYVATMAADDPTSDTVPVRPEAPRTAIHSFDLHAADGADYAASGEVDGMVLNSYALSEHESVLRVATTTSSGGFGQSQESGVHVFEQRGDELVEVGTLGGLGRTETIQGVRFLGDKGYVVTFRQTDPLFVIDLSDPTAPTLRGELKVPGFSTYLHPIGDDRLLAIGYEGTEGGQILGTQLSLFDVSDPAAPTLVDTMPIGEHSEAAFDPHAFLYWAETGMIVVPVQEQCEQQDNAEMYKVCSSAVVGGVTPHSVDERARLAGDGSLQRTMVASNRLVTVSDTGVGIYDLSTLAEIGAVTF